MDVTFYVDAPLKRLCRWLRIFGYECNYCPTLTANDLDVQVPFAKGSVFLTRQPSLHQKLLELKICFRVIFINYNNWREQLQQVIHELKLEKPEIRFNHCIHCGTKLKKILNMNKVITRVPPYIFETHGNFSECEKCHRIYWPGTHTLQLKKLIDQLFNEIE